MSDRHRLSMRMGRAQKIRVLLNRSNGIALAILLLCLSACWWLWEQPELNLLTPQGLRQTIQNLGFLGVLVYIFVLALSVVVSPIPGAPMAVAAGTVWGSFLAGIYSVIGGFLGSLIAYYIGRTLGRSAIQALTGKVIYFTKQRGEFYLGWFIFINRLLPVLPFDLMSYGAGMTGLSLPIYASATLLGMTPSTLFLTYLGSTFTVKKPLAIVLALILLFLVIGLTWGIRRHNWLGLKDMIRVE